MPIQTQSHPVRKADRPALVAVYDQAGRLVGVADPAKITPVSTLADGMASDMKKSVYQSPDLAEQARAAQTLNAAAIATFQRIRQQPRRVTR